MTNALIATVGQQRCTEQHVAIDSIQDVSPTVMLVRLTCEDCAWWADYQSDPDRPVLLRSLFGAALHLCPTTHPAYTNDDPTSP